MSGDGAQLTGQAAFEAALDVLLELITRGQELAAEERGRPRPDAERLGQWQRRIGRWVSMRDELDPRDAAAVAAVLEVEGSALRSLRSSDG